MNYMKPIFILFTSLICITPSQGCDINTFEERSQQYGQPESPLLTMPNEVLTRIVSYEGVAEALKGRACPDGVPILFMRQLDPNWDKKTQGPICVRLEMIRRLAPCIQIFAENIEQISGRKGSLLFKNVRLAFPTTVEEFKDICKTNSDRQLIPFILMPSPLTRTLKDLGITPLIEKTLKNSIMFDPDKDCADCNRPARYTSNMTAFQLIEHAARATLQEKDCNYFLDLARIFGSKNSGLKLRIKINREEYNRYVALYQTVCRYVFPADMLLTDYAKSKPAEQLPSLIAKDLKVAVSAVKQELDTAKWSEEHGSVNATFNNALTDFKNAITPGKEESEPIYEVDFSKLFSGFVIKK